MNTICASAFWDKVFKNGPQNIGGEAKKYIIVNLSTQYQMFYFVFSGIWSKYGDQWSIFYSYNQITGKYRTEYSTFNRIYLMCTDFGIQRGKGASSQHSSDSSHFSTSGYTSRLFFFLEIFDIRAKDKVEFDLKKEVISFENRTK